MAKIARRKTLSFSICIIFILFLTNLINGDKNKKEKQTMKSEQKSAEERKNQNQWEENSNRKCSTNVKRLAEEGGKEKDNGRETGKEEEEEDEDARQLVANFVAFFKASASKGAPTEGIVATLRLNSVLWFLRRKIVALLSFAKIFLADDEHLVGTVEEFVREWENAFGGFSGENALKKQAICTQYKFGIFFIKMMAYYANGSEELAQYLSREIPLDIFRVDADILLNCVQKEQIERICSDLFEKMGDINGQNIVRLLDIYEDFRQFFCSEMADMRRTKAALYTLIKSEYVTKIEDKFPKMFRIDIMLNPSLFERFCRLLMNKSFSIIYRMEFIRLTMAFLINRLISFECLIDGKVDLSDQLIVHWKERAKKAISAAYGDLVSEENMCVLIKMNNVFAQLISLKGAQNRSEELSRDTRTDQCAEESKRAETVERFRKSELGELYLTAIERTVAYRSEHFIAVLRTPGTKTRLKQLIGSDQKMAGLIGKSALIGAFREITLTRSDILWQHYEVVLLSENALISLDSKLTADVSVFLSWLKAKFDQLKVGSFWDQIVQYFEMEIYDPLFDQNEAELKGSEQFLIRIFIETKHFVKKMVENDKKRNNGNNFKKWKEIIEGEGMKSGKIEGRELKKHLQWMKERHRKEFGELLRGEKMSNFIKMLTERGVEKIRKNIGKFFDAKTLGEILSKLPTDGEFNAGKIEMVEQKGKKEGQNAIGGQKAIEGQNGQNRMGGQNAIGGQKAMGGQNAIGGQKAMGGQKAIGGQNTDNAMGQNGDTETVENGDNLHFQCPPANVSVERFREMDGAMALNKEVSERQNNAMEMKAHAMLWYIVAFLRNLMAFAVECADDGHFSGSNFALELQKVKKGREELLDGSESKWGKLLLLFEFGKYFVRNKILWENSERWQMRLISEQMIELDEAKSAESWVKPNFDEKEAKDYFARLQLDPKRDADYMHFFAISELIGHSPEVQRFFCDLSDSKIIQKVKTKVSIITDEEYLLQLDEMFPEILQIDVLIPWTQIALYKRLFNTKSGTEQHFVLECRIALPLLLHRLRWLIGKTPTVRGQMLDAFREKLQQIRRIAFRGLRRELVGIGETKLVGEWLAKSVCILYCFFLFTWHTFALPNEAKGMVKTEDIRKWHSGDNCEGEETLTKAYQKVHGFLIQTHGRHLQLFLRLNMANLKDFVRAKRGRRSRMRKLVGGEDAFMDNFRMELRDPNVFSNSRLADDYLGALFDLDKATRVVGTLSAFIAVWVRWMEHQFWTDDSLSEKPLEEKRTNRLKWARVGLFFEDLYDELVDVANFDELEQMSDFLRELQRSIWDEFVWEAHSSRKKPNRRKKQHQEEEGRKEKPRERGANQKKQQEEEEGGKRQKQQRQQQQHHERMALNLGQNRTKFRIKWENLWTQWHKIMEKAQQTARGIRMMEGDREYERWIDGIHWDTLITLLGEDGGTFGESLRNGFERDVRAKARLKDFINWEMIETLMQLLEKNNGEEFEKGLEVIRQREGWEGQETEETEEELERKSREENALAERRMIELISEEEHLKEVKKMVEERQLEKRKRQKVRERRPIEKKRGKGLKEKTEAGSMGNKEKEGNKEKIKGNENENNLANKKAKNKKREQKKQRMVAKAATESNSPTTEGQSEANEKQTLELLNEFNGISLMQFISDEFLLSKYEEFINERTETKRELLGIGTLINAIWNRMKIMEEMSQMEGHFGEGFGEKVAKIGGEWRKLAENETLKGEKVIESAEEVEKIRQQMLLLLRRATFVMEGMENWEENGKMGEENAKMRSEGAKLTAHLSRNEFLRAIASKKSAAQSWHKLSETERNEVLSAMLGGRKTNLAGRFDELLEDWRTKVAQQRIDRNLHEQFEKGTKCHFGQLEISQFALNFIENSQQMYLNCDGVRQQKETLYAFFNENEFNDCQKELTTDDALIGEVKGIVEKWDPSLAFPSVGSARLVLSGSFLLGAPTAHSDIDMICIVPQRMALDEEKQRFYGNESSICNLSVPAEERFCEDDSLYCRFCKNDKVISLLKIPFAQIPLLQLKLAAKEFDITFVAVPFIGRLPNGPLNGADVDALLEGMASGGKAYEAMRKSLASYLDNVRIIEMLTEKKVPKFKQLLFMLKLWAQTNHIYGNMFGFLNGICLAIIAAKTFFWYPKSSVPFLFEKALLILLIWNWPVPIKLDDKNNCDFAGHKMPELAPPLMSIITPSNLAQNGAKNVNASTFKIIKNEIKRTLFQLKLMKNSQENGRNDWPKLFPVRLFSEKFALFVLISCVVSAPQHIDQFCGFVERRIRPSLLHFDQKTAHLVEYSHLMPDKHLAKGNQCPQKAIGPQFVRTPHCKVWLVGLKLLKIENENWEVGKYLNERFNSEFDANIYAEYDNIVLRGWYQNIKLASTVVLSPAELKEWKINTY